MTTPGTGAYGFAGEVVIVTGAAMGIGAGIAEVLADAGATVIVADIDHAKAREQAAALVAAGGNADHVALDLADEDSVVRAFAEVRERHGALWGMVNNAGLQHREMLLDGTAAHWDRINGVNARGAFLVTREAARAMVAGGGGGRIVHVASAALIGALTQGHAAYAASKAALLGLTRAAALELAAQRITVNLVLPGGVATPGAMAVEGPPPEGPGRRVPQLGWPDPRDIGAACAFFTSPAAGKITNQALAVDAGWSVT
jgi:NAD(P)-dependent dehydrogenase (short-subunit alcohol dehydrogenase family)